MKYQGYNSTIVFSSCPLFEAICSIFYSKHYRHAQDLYYQSLSDFVVGTWRLLLSVFVLQEVAEKRVDIIRSDGSTFR